MEQIEPLEHEANVNLYASDRVEEEISYIYPVPSPENPVKRITSALFVKCLFVTSDVMRDSYEFNFLFLVELDKVIDMANHFTFEVG